MSIDDERIVRILAGMTDAIVPAPDPYARVRRRFRRRQRRRAATAGLAALAVLAGTGMALAGPGGGTDRPTDPPVDPWESMRAWSESMWQSPPRGRVGADKGYVATLSALVLQAQAAGKLRWKTPMIQANVLFADDVGKLRVALVALARKDPAPNEWSYVEVWLAGPKGASPQALTRDMSTASTGDGLEPLAKMTLGGVEPVNVAVAPSDCAFQTAKWPAVDRWTPEPTGSYLVRTGPRPEWWRIVCDGVVRQSMPGIGSPVGSGITSQQVTAAIAGARGKVDRVRARELLNNASAWGYGATAVPRLVWMGRTTGTRPDGDRAFDGRAGVIAAPAVGGGWLGELTVEYDVQGPNSVGASQPFRTSRDPSDPSFLLAIRLELAGEGGSLLVIAPTGSATIQILRDGREVASAPVRDAAAVLNPPPGGQVTVRALDAAGKPLATGAVAGPGTVLGEDHWAD